MNENLAILLMRIAGMGLKAFFIFFSAKYLSLHDFGNLALINTTISLMLCMMGMNFIYHTNRVLVDNEDKINVVFNHFVIICLFGLASYIVLPIFIYFDALNIQFLWKFVVILYAEHLLNEIFLLLIPLNRSLLANLIYFLRICCAYLLPIFYIIKNPSMANLDSVLNIWLYSILGFLALILTIASFKLKIFNRKLNFTLDFVRAGLKTSALFLIVAIIGKSFFTLDKYIVNYFNGAAEVGIYNFYYSIAWTIPTLVETSLITPSLYKMLNSNDKKSIYAKLVINGVILSLLLVIAFTLFKELILDLLNKREFEKDISLFYIFAGGGLMFSLAQATAMPMYAKRKDGRILRANVSTLLFFALLSFFNHDSKYSIAYNLCLTCGFLFLSLLFYYRKDLKTNPNL